jgi:hypothetical protein
MLKAGEVFEIAMLAHGSLHGLKHGPLPRGVRITGFVIPEAAQRLSGIHTPRARVHRENVVTATT